MARLSAFKQRDERGRAHVAADLHELQDRAHGPQVVRGAHERERQAQHGGPGEDPEGMTRDELVNRIDEIIRDNIPKPDDALLPEECQSEQAFYTWNIDTCLTYMPEDWTFDPIAMTEDINTRLAIPLQEAQRLFADYSYMTRLFSTLSPEEMTKDPIFSFNPDLPDVSNVHIVEGSATCSAEKPWMATQVTFKFEDGQVITHEGEFQQCAGFDEGASADAAAQPPAAGIQVLRESGDAEWVAPEDVAQKEEELDAQYPTEGMADTPADPRRNDDADTNTGTFGTPPGQPPEQKDDGCQSAPAANAILAFFSIAALWATRRRRRLETHKRS